MFTTSIDGGVFNISLCVGNIADMVAKPSGGVVFEFGR